MSVQMQAHKDRVSLQTTTQSPQSPSKSSDSPGSESAASTQSICRRYDPGVSILLLGMRGTGLSTLAFMAARALKYRVLDSDQAFHRTTGMSRASYKSTHGAVKYRTRELELLRWMLSENRRRTILVANLGAVQEAGQEHIAEYSKNHPVIYVSRDAKAVQAHLKSQDVEFVTSLIRRSDSIYRRLSSYEFHNLCDTSTKIRSPNGDIKALSLKQLEQDFIHFLQGIAFRSPAGERCDLKPTPICCSVESRQFTYLVPVLISGWSDAEQKYKEADLEADALELVFPVHDTTEQTECLDDNTATTVTRQFFSVRRHGRLPIVFRPQPKAISEDDERSKALDERYIQVLHHGLKLCPEYLCVDLSLDDAVILKLAASKGFTKIIGDFHDHDPGPNGWSRGSRKEQVLRGQRLGYDLIRITQPATTMDDNFAVRQFAYECKTDDRIQIPVIAYNTGRLGRTSQFLNHHLSPVTDPALSAGVYQRPLSKYLLTVRDAQAALYSSLVLDKLTFGIYGSDVAPSLSPQMHNAAFRFCGMPHEYTVLQYATLQHLPEILRKEDCGGLSISAPFKREAQQYVDSMSPEARAIGAINTIVPLRSNSGDVWSMRNRAGKAVKLYGDNTDWAGIYVCVQRNLSPINAIKPDTTALVLGAGGMARATVFALIRLGVRTIFIYNRTVSKAIELAENFQSQTLGHMLEYNSCDSQRVGSEHESSGANIRVLESRSNPWPKDVRAPTVIVSCVAVHEVDGQASADCTLPANWLKSTTGGTAVELAYNPIETPLLQQIRGLADRGWVACDGLEVLPEQGIKQFELFTGRKAPQRLMREEVRRILRGRDA